MKYFALLILAFNSLSILYSQATISWQPLYEPGTGGRINSLAISPYNPDHYLAGGDMLGIAVSFNKGEKWQSSFGLKSYEINYFTFHPVSEDTIWVGTLSGPYMSTDKGFTWIEKRNGMPAIASSRYSAPVQQILFNPKNSSHLLAFEGSHRNWANANSHWGGVWESLDGGSSWNLKSSIGSSDDWPGIVGVKYAGTNDSVLFAAHQKLGVFKSIDRGKIWIRVGEGSISGDPSSIACHPDNDSIVYVSTLCFDQGGWKPGAVFKSTDQGHTWQKKINGLNQSQSSTKDNNASFSKIVISDINPEILYAADLCNWPSGLYKSINGGDTWVNTLVVDKYKQIIKAYVPGSIMRTLAVSGINGDQLLAGNTETIFQTLNGGLTYTDISSTRVSTNPDKFIGNGYSGLCSVDYHFNTNIPNYSMFGAMDDGFFWQSRDSYKSWKWGGTGLTHWGGAREISSGGSQGEVIFVCIGQGGNFKAIGKSTNGGNNWVELNGSNSSGLPAKNTAGKMATSIYVHPSETNMVWAVVGKELLRSVNGGSSWSAVFAGKEANKLAASLDNPLKMYLTAVDGIYKSEDGINFNLMHGSPPAAQFITIDPLNDDRIYATIWRNNNPGLYQFDNNRWERIWNNYYAYAIAIDPSDSSRILVTTHDNPYHDHCGGSGVYMSEDFGKTFRTMNSGLPVLRVPIIRLNPFNPREIVCGTSGRGYFLGNINYPDLTHKASENILAYKYSHQTGMYFNRQTQAMAYINGGDSIVFNKIDFDSAYTHIELVAMNNGDEPVEAKIFLDGIEVGSLVFPAGSDTFEVYRTVINTSIGIHQLKLTFSGSNFNNLQLKTFCFNNKKNQATAINEKSLNDKILVYPNPVNGRELMVQFTESIPVGDYLLRLFSLNGQLVYSKKISIDSIGSGIIKISSKELNISGSHILSLFTHNELVLSRQIYF